MKHRNSYRHRRLDTIPVDTRDVYRRLDRLRDLPARTPEQSAELMRLWLVAAHFPPTPPLLPPDNTGEPAPLPDEA